jgi:hypothetical protein
MTFLLLKFELTCVSDRQMMSYSLVWNVNSVDLPLAALTLTRKRLNACRLPGLPVSVFSIPPR